MTVRRIKTYTADTGYVYEYYFVGKRPATIQPGEPPTTECVFEVSRDRKHNYAVRILLTKSVLDEWAARHGRSLTDAEQYAAVKMRLFEAFDQLDDLAREGWTLVVDREALNTALATLGVD